MAVTLLAAGDLCPGDHYFTLGHGTGSRIASGVDPFAPIERVLRDADLRLANLEGPLSAISSRNSGPEARVFRGPPLAAALIRRAGIELVHIANNHILQHGVQAFETTLSLLEEQGLSAVGQLDGDLIRPVTKTLNGLVLGFLGCSFIPEEYIPGQHLYACLPLPSVLDQIEELRAQVDLVVVSVHWGVEATALPTREIVDAAHAMVDAGATLVLGHHPHWFQPLEHRGRALIAYSLGHLIFDLFWDRRLIESALLKVTLDSAGVVDYALIPVSLGKDYQLRLQTQASARRFLAELEYNQRLVAKPLVDRAVLPKGQRVRKLAYFLSALPRGNTSDKLRFVLAKVASTFRRGALGAMRLPR